MGTIVSRLVNVRKDVVSTSMRVTVKISPLSPSKPTPRTVTRSPTSKRRSKTNIRELTTCATDGPTAKEMETKSVDSGTTTCVSDTSKMTNAKIMASTMDTKSASHVTADVDDDVPFNDAFSATSSSKVPATT